MIPMARLTSAVYGCIHTSNGQSFAGSKSRTPESCSFLATPLFLAPSLPGTKPSLFPLLAPDLSLFAASQTFAAARSRGGPNHCLHCQTATALGGSASSLCPSPKTHLEPNGQPSLVRPAGPRAEAWLSAGPKPRVTYNWNITGTACWSRSWSKPINAWCRNGSGHCLHCRRT